MLSAFIPNGVRTAQEIIESLERSHDAHVKWCRNFRVGDILGFNDLLYRLRVIQKYEDAIQTLSELPGKMRCPRWVDRMVEMDLEMTAALNGDCSVTERDQELISRLQLGVTVSVPSGSILAGSSKSNSEPDED